RSATPRGARNMSPSLKLRPCDVAWRLQGRRINRLTLLVVHAPIAVRVVSRLRTNPHPETLRNLVRTGRLPRGIRGRLEVLRRLRTAASVFVLGHVDERAEP